MVDGGDAASKKAPGPPDSTLPSPGAEAPHEAPAEEASVDSFLRAAAHISELPSGDEHAPSGQEGRASARGNLTAGAIIAKRYRLERELGRGGMGVVWEASHEVTRRRVAMKFVIGPADVRADLRRRFLREARAASAADHPNVVEVLDVFELDDGTPVMVMELLDGETLRARLVRERKLSLEVTASVLLPVVAAVGTAHRLGIVHRDLKPENIFLVAGAAPTAGVKVLDFGVAKLLSTDGAASETESLTGTGAAVGTPCYMAPEQTRGEKDIDARADVWAVGVIAYECLAGVRPVEGSGIGQVVTKLLTEGIKPIEEVVPGLPREASALVMRMLARDRRDRPQDLANVQAALAKFTSVELRPFDTPSAEARRVDSGSTPQARTPGVDTQSPQAIPGVERRERRGMSGVMIVGAVGAAALVAGIAGWRATARPDAEEGMGSASAASMAPRVLPTGTATPSPTTASTPTPTAIPTKAPIATTAPTPAPNAPKSSTTHAKPDAAAPAAPASGTGAAPRGLVQKPPF